jgi:P4 family phage/plasmid primase-like protien
MVSTRDDPLGDLWEGEQVQPFPSASPLAQTTQQPLASVEHLIRGDHVEVGEKLRSHFESQGVLSFADDSLWQCNGKQYFELVTSAEASREIHGFAGAAVAVKGNKPLLLKQSDVKGALQVLKDLVAEPDFFLNAPDGISFRDCFVRVEGKTLTRVPNGPDNRARHQLPFDYLPNAAPSRQLLDFFGDCFAGCDDASERVECIRQFVGLCLLGLGTRFHRALVLLGGGANGKSVLISLIQRAFPENAVSATPAQRWSHEYHRAKISGSLINAVSELPEGDIIDSASFKAIISGDLTDARRPHGHPFDFRPRAGHLFATNTLPGTNDQTQGFWRRFIVIGFPNSVPLERQNSHLADQLARNLPEFVGWCLAGAAEALSKDALTIPSSSGPAIDTWRSESDQVTGFLQESTTADPLSQTAAAELYRQYRSWCALNGHKQLSSTTFGRRVKLAGLEPQRTKRGLFYPVRVLYTAPE